ncbi:MAG: trigger factor [Patescibacteria group bacterium]
MSSNITHLPKSRVELKFSVTPEEARPYLEQAAIDISTARPIKGFRPGKAGFDDVVREYGEALVWETALERIVRAKYVKTVLDEDLETIGSPEIGVGKLVPNQDMDFTVTATLMPKVSNLADYSQQLVVHKIREIKDAEVDAALTDLRKMRRTETITDQPAGAEDLAVIDLEIKQDGVIVEGGVSRDYKVYLGEQHYIPGFSHELIGVTKGQEKSFELEFPKDHYNKQLAGKKTSFVAKIKEVFKLDLPALDDEFAKTLGFETLDKLKAQLKQNLQTEADEKSNEAAEIEMLDKLVKNSKFNEIPELLVNQEVHRMQHEMESALEERGVNMNDYLTSLKKTHDQLMLDLVPQAIQRVQTAVLLKAVAKQEKCEVEEKEVDEEIDRIMAFTKPEDKESREQIASPEYRDYVMSRMKNRKTLELLKQKTIK